MNYDEISFVCSNLDTPCFVFDIDCLRDRLKKIKQIIGSKINLCYAIKANPFILSDIDDIVSNFEVCSPGELTICENQHINMPHIIFSGVNKTKEDISRAIEDNVGIITIESLLHLSLVNETAHEKNVVIPVLLRLTSGNQFGMDETELTDVIKNRKLYKHIKIVGLHYFVGTQRKKVHEQESDVENLLEICDKIKNAFGFTFEKIEYGPGLPFPYFTNDNDSDTLLPLKTIMPYLEKLSKIASLTIEMGRFVVSDCGYYFTKVIDTKTNKNVNYAILDGGINHVNYYGQLMGMNVPKIIHFKDNTDKNSAIDWTLCGSLCSINDILVRNTAFENLEIGNKLVFCNIGAYSVTEGLYMFLSRKMPKIFLYSKLNGYQLIRDSFCTDTLNTKI